MAKEILIMFVLIKVTPLNYMYDFEQIVGTGLKDFKMFSPLLH